MSLGFSLLAVNNVYIRIWKNRISARHIEKNVEMVAHSPRGFATERLLIGNLEEASQALRTIMSDLFGKRRFFMASPAILIHPKEMTDGGLAAIEERIFVELATSIGASKALVHVGTDLSDVEVKQLLNKK